MKREIKFKAWDKVNNRFCNHEFLISTINGGVIDIVGVSTDQDVNLINEDIELLQFTGLKDKNGVEAYHKDIVASGKKHYTIEWQDEEARFWLAPLNHSGTWKFMDELNHMKIIGNTYEN